MIQISYGKVKSASIVIGRARRFISAGAYLRFLYYEATRTISTPLDGILVHCRLPPSNLSGCPQSNLLVLHLSGERHCES